jgi:ABC-type multidrug transport system ATPase subunit
MDESIIPETVSAFLEVLDMEHLADHLTGGYSGGNKRKLSLAIAMIANPSLVFLDGKRNNYIAF